jgi:quercetin dioxygenase-like cupin family protein
MEHKNAPKGVVSFKGPTLVRYKDATRFLWGDRKSGEVADVIYGRNEVIGTLIYKLKPGGFFRSSDTWKSYFDQDRFYYVLKGEIAVQDPTTGDVAVAHVGEAVHWRGAKWHFGYNCSSDETVVLDWYAPQERPPHISELEFASTKPSFQGEQPGRFDLLGKWPAALGEQRIKAQTEGGLITARKADALHFIFGERHPIVESLYVSTANLTAGTVDLLPGVQSDARSHPSDKVIFVIAAKLHVYLPESYDWFELDEWDLLYLPAGTQHQYWNYTGRVASFAFMVVPNYA